MDWKKMGAWTSGERWLCNAEDPDLIRNLNLFVVNRFYLKPYDQNQDFYIQFYERLKEGKELLALA